MTTAGQGGQTPQADTGPQEKFDLSKELEQYFAESSGTFAEKIAGFPRFTPRQRLTDFLSHYETFKKVLDIPGSVVDCGVYRGRTLMAYAQLSAILEPVNYQRQIIGFDTFEGFLKLDEQDSRGTHEENRVGGYSAEVQDELMRGIELYDANRYLGQMQKVVLVKGDIAETAPRFLEENPHTVVSLLCLDLGLYAPTKAALQAFLPRMPKGAVVTFSEANCSDFSGEVTAVLEELGVRNLQLKRHPFDTVASHAVLE